MAKPRRLSFTEGQDPSPLVTVGDVSDRGGQKPDTVNQWVLRASARAPVPVLYTVGGALYWWDDWLEWFRERRPAAYEKIPRYYGGPMEDETTSEGGEE
jgi:hypothetical protein